MNFDDITNMCMGDMMIHSTPEEIIKFAAHQGFLKAVSELDKLGSILEKCDIHEHPDVTVKNCSTILKCNFNHKENK